MTTPRLAHSIGAALAVIAGLVALVITAPLATAQESDEGVPVLAVASQTASPDVPFTVSVSLDTVGANLGAVAADLTYDPSVLRFVNCAAGSASTHTGVCNDLGGVVSFAAISLTGFASEPSFFTADFIPLAAVEATDFTIELVTVAGVTGLHVEAVGLDGGVDFADADAGVTGQIIASDSRVGLFGIEVCATDTADAAAGPAACTTSSGIGDYRIDGLTPGEWLLTMVDPSGDYLTADHQVTLAPGELLTGVDAELLAPATVGETPQAPDSTVVGQVLSPTGEPVFGVEVCATAPVVQTHVCAFTAQDGVFSIGDLSVGTHTISAIDHTGRFDAPGDELVGIGADGAGVSGLTIVMSEAGLGDVPEELAFVNRQDGGSDVAPIVLAALVAHAGIYIAVRRRSS